MLCQKEEKNAMTPNVKTLQDTPYTSPAEIAYKVLWA
jgi:hypothetical protein